MARAHKNITAIGAEITKCPVNIDALNKLIIRIFLYSAMNRKANPAPPYSMLNPDTNSDSPSAKSNGARLVSAKITVIHMIASGIRRKVVGKARLVWRILTKSIWPFSKR